MDAFVSARVPVEVKTQVAQRLKEIGATQSELVNAAFSYVLAVGELPSSKREDNGKGRRLSNEQALEVRRRLEETTFAVPESAWEGKDYKDILAEGRSAAYEALS